MKLLLTLIKNKFIPWLIVIICLLVTYLYVEQLNAKKVVLQQSNAQLQQDKQQLIDIIDYKNKELLTLSEHYDQNEHHYIEQKNKLQDINVLNRQYQQQLERLKNENESLRLWSTRYLPDDVKRLHLRPEIKGSDDYRQWLSKRNTVLSSKQ